MKTHTPWQSAVTATDGASVTGAALYAAGRGDDVGVRRATAAGTQQFSQLWAGQ